MKLSASILTASTEGHRACRKTANWWCPDFKNHLVPSLQQSVWRYVRNTNSRLWKCLQALLSLSILQLEHFMAQAVWNRYCGQQHKYWICQESWHCVQHICNCNLAPTRSNSKQPLRNNIFFPPPFLFLKKLRESLFRWLSAPRSCILTDWELTSTCTCTCTHTALENIAAAAHVPPGWVGFSHSLLQHLVSNFRRERVFLQQYDKLLFPLRSY